MSDVFDRLDLAGVALRVCPGCEETVTEREYCLHCEELRREMEERYANGGRSAVVFVHAHAKPTVVDAVFERLAETPRPLILSGALASGPLAYLIGFLLLRALWLAL